MDVVRTTTRQQKREPVRESDFNYSVSIVSLSNIDLYRNDLYRSTGRMVLYCPKASYPVHLAFLVR